MSTERTNPQDPRIQAAITALTGLIRDRYPTASFTVDEGDDPVGVYVTVTVDVDDTDEVVDRYIDRMVDVQVSEGLPVYVIPVRPIERVTAAHTQTGRGTPASSKEADA